MSICCTFCSLTVFLFILNRVFHWDITSWGRDSAVICFYSDEFLILARMHAIGRKCFKIFLNCFVLLFKILIAFFMSGLGQVLLNSDP